ncbi:MAG: hypothetical protein M1817_004292 [Caeruleum heppii]|nr:MAG: hypothetical protein M1817_004292 [Caeruleum heppii]
MLDDPASATIYRTSGAPPYPAPNDPRLPPQLAPRQVTLRDRVTIATIVPFSSFTQVPPSLLAYLCEQFNREIDKGDTYPMIEPMPLSSFGPYWFANFGAIMLVGEIAGADQVLEGKDWSSQCLGSFYIKPNYPGRSSHVCNGGFLVCDAARNKGVGRLMGEAYLEWAPMLGYTYSVFNLVYETNVASCRIWDALGFKRIGRVKGCGDLKSFPDQLTDAIIYGRDLGPEGEDFVSEERFDKIKFYLKHGKYPNGADRAEKSRLRSAATHYKLTEDDKLMLKDKEVVSDPQKQYEIARAVHVLQHGGINKTTATIAEKYHWVRIKETVSLVIRNCADCKEMAKAPVVKADSDPAKKVNVSTASQGGVSAAGRVLSLPTTTPDSDSPSSIPSEQPSSQPMAQPMAQAMAQPLPQAIPQAMPQQMAPQMQQHHAEPHRTHRPIPMANMQHLQDYSDIPLDPQIMQDVEHHLTHYTTPDGHGHHFQPHQMGPLQGHHPLMRGHQPPISYQALLQADHPKHPNAHLQNFVTGRVAGPEESESMAAKATAAARAAQDAMVDIDGMGEEADGEREMKRMMAAGYVPRGPT